MTNLLGLPKELCWVRYKLQAEARLAKKKKNGQHLPRDYCPPGHQNPAMGFFWGVDQD